MKLRLNISPCPNDTFMFDALVNGRIDTLGLEFETSFHDIEQLNSRALAAQADITKISCAVLPEIADSYILCDSGSALGRGNGPLLVCRDGDRARIIQALGCGDLKIAVPGLHTTATLLMCRLFPRATNKPEVLFSEIARGVSDGLFDAGVLIHEGRFTYRDQGLELVYDLGSEWEKQTGLPLPLGGIALSRSLPHQTAKLFESLLRQSINFAFDHPDLSREFVRAHAREMDEKVIASHIALFVNDYSHSLGPAGRLAVRELTGCADSVFL